MNEVDRHEGTPSSVVYRHGSDGIFILAEDHYHKIPYAEILFPRAFGEKCFIHTRDGEKVLVGHCLSKVMRHLPATHFLRVHDIFVVSLFDIDKFSAGALYIGKLYFPVGRRFHSDIIAALNLLRRSIKDALSGK